MKKYLPVLAVAAVAAVIIVLAVGHKNNNSTTNGNNSSSTMNMNSGSNNSSSSSSQPTATNKVTIQNFNFSPASITVKKGTTVTWANNDSTTHTVTADSGTGPNSGDLSPGKSYSFTFSSTGTFHYHCSIHPEMTGTVTVTQ